MDPVYFTAWLATLLFLGSRLRISFFPSQFWDRVGVVCLWIHIVVAYALTHGWSHQLAVEHVARRTDEMTGIRSGFGIYLNFLVAIVWTWLAYAARTESLVPATVESSPQASGLRNWRINWRIAVEVFLGLMFFSASVVFADWASAVCFSILWIWLAVRSLRPILGRGLES